MGEVARHTTLSIDPSDSGVASIEESKFQPLSHHHHSKLSSRESRGERTGVCRCVLGGGGGGIRVEVAKSLSTLRCSLAAIMISGEVLKGLQLPHATNPCMLTSHSRRDYGRR